MVDPPPLREEHPAGRRPLVLLSNDDGFASRRLRALFVALQTWADVVVVAPQAEQSASSHALSLHRPLRARRMEERIFAIDGTPADCVNIAIAHLLPHKVEGVVSGINVGYNCSLGFILSSGTVAGAWEGALHGLPAIGLRDALRHAEHISVIR